MPIPIIARIAAGARAARVATVNAGRVVARSRVGRTVGMGAKGVGKAASATASLGKKATQAGGSVLNTALTGAMLMQSVQGMMHAVTNDFTHVINVEVVGGPDASIKRIWNLAVSAAFGKYRQGAVGGGDLTISATWDITGKSVAVQLHYSSKGLFSEIITGGDQRFTSYSEFLRHGPSQELVGGDWSLWPGKVKGVEADKKQPPGAIVGGILQAYRDGQLALGAIGGGLVIGSIGLTPVPVRPLPDDGRVILTNQKENPHVQPYRPKTDYLLALVSASLTDPCVLPVAPPTDAMAGQVANRRSYRVYPPGGSAGQETLINSATDNRLPLVIPPGGLVFASGSLSTREGIDGYKEPDATVNVRGDVNRGEVTGGGLVTR